RVVIQVVRQVLSGDCPFSAPAKRQGLARRAEQRQDHETSEPVCPPVQHTEAPGQIRPRARASSASHAMRDRIAAVVAPSGMTHRGASPNRCSRTATSSKSVGAVMTNLNTDLPEDTNARKAAASIVGPD